MEWRRLVVAICACLAVAACGGETLEFADWIVPVPEAARVVEYAPVPPARRTERIELVEDLVVGAGDDPGGRLYRPADVAVAGNGDIYAADSGRHRVLVFDGRGDFLRSLGREGEGPGEFQSAQRMQVAVVDDRVVVSDGRELSVWSLTGELVDDSTMEAGPFNDLEPGGDRSVVARYEHVSDVTSPAELVARHALDGRELVRYASVDKPGSPPYDESMNRWVWIHQAAVSRAAGPTLEVAVGPPGTVYVNPLVEYQLLRMDPSGAVDWALRVAWPRADYPEETMDQRLESLQQRAPDARRQDIDWPARQPALSAVGTDGHGHVYAVPIRDLSPSSEEEDEEEEDEDVLADVYSEDAEHLFSGYLPGHAGGLWSAAHDDFVYDIRTNETSGEYELVRYRLVEPFDRDRRDH